MTFKNYQKGGTILETDYLNILQEVNKKWGNKIKKIEEGKKVYFNPNIQIPRREFKKNYPNNPIVHDLAQADIIVTKNKPSVYINFGYGAYKKNQIILDESYSKWGIDSVLRNLNECVDYSNNTGTLTISPESIEINGEGGELKENTIDKITSMLQSPDKETVNLGLKILFNHDHTINTEKFFLIICKANKRSWYSRSKSRLTEQKINYIKSLYPNHKL